VAKLTKEELKARIVEVVDERARDIRELAEDIFRHPELGYKEFRTCKLVQEKFTGLGLPFRSGLAITGVKARRSGRRSGPSVAVLGELDAVVCPGHPQADPSTGAAHACGHHGQIAAMYGAAAGLCLSGAFDHISGDVVFMAVPAEEYVEIEYRHRLRQEGKIRFIGGKQELLALGEFDDVDMAMMVHQGSLAEGKQALVGGTSNGFLGKLVRYRGVEAHAGGAPHAGVNALNAAMLGLTGIHMLRETFKDEDSIRVHPIITKGGDLVNVVPADVRAETYVRGRTMAAILDANAKVNRALTAGASALGAQVEITELPGYLPRVSAPALDQVFKANLLTLLNKEAVGEGGHGAGSSDMGDLMHVMPGIHPSIGGCRGRAHSEEFQVCDAELAYVVPAKALAMTVVDLLWDQAGVAKRVLKKWKPLYTRAGYFQMWEEVVGRGRS
jgi:amidohydrolase